MMCCHPDHSHLQKQERLTDQFLYLTFGVKPTGTAAVNGLARRFHFFLTGETQQKAAPSRARRVLSVSLGLDVRFSSWSMTDS